MFKNYLKVAVRNLLKYRTYSLINIIGLALGMACCLLILLFVRDELSYDRFHEHADRLFRVSFKITLPEQPVKYMAVSGTPTAPALRDEIPEIVEATRMTAYFEAALPGRAAVSHGDNEFNDRFFWTDTSFFKVFSFRFLYGNRDTALAAPNCVVITEEMAQKYFGDDNPIGKVLKIDTGFTQEDYQVTGVTENVPRNSHMHYDVLASLVSLENVGDERVNLNDWADGDSYTYVLLAPGADPAVVEEKFHQVILKNTSEWLANLLHFYMIPVPDIHLHSQVLNELEPNSDIVYVYIFTTVAFVILLVACINFMNLATARSANRAREVGMRKVVGAYRSQLIGQFMGESLVVSFIAMLLALLMVRMALPAFNAFVNKDLSLGYGMTTWAGLVGLTLLVGIVAGSYPALFLSSFRPVNVLGGTLASGPKSGLFRKVLVVVQFCFSVMLIIGTFVVYDQLNYMRNQDLGINMDRVVVFPVRDSTLKDRYLTVKDQVERVPNISGTAFSALIMGREAPDLGTLPDGAPEWKLMGSLIQDQDWIDFYGLELIAGRTFSRELGEAEMRSFIVSETGMRELGWSTPEEALGHHLIWFAGLREGNVIGVVKDFHYQPLKYPIKPVIMLLRPIAYHFLAVRIGPGDVTQTLNDLQGIWPEIFPNRPFSYFFLEDEFNRMYRADQQLGELIGIFSLMAVFLGCLGLVGLASFTAEQRTKEIGVRKVLGATAMKVVVLLSKEFTRLILVAIVIAWPVAFLVMREWLSDFAYRTDLEIGYFVAGGLIALLIGALSVAFQAIKAAFANPADALRYE